MKECHLSYSRVEDIIQENFGKERQRVGPHFHQCDHWTHTMERSLAQSVPVRHSNCDKLVTKTNSSPEQTKAEKVVKITPFPYDDILLDIVWSGIKKALKK